MFGQNPVAKNEGYLTGETLTVVGGAPFYTIQGEGPYAGCPAMFLRLHGCPLRCHFCDTNFSSPDDPRLAVSQIIDMMVAMWPVTHIQSRPLAVITGGEPLRQNLEPLITELLEMGWLVQIETAGIFWQNILDNEDVEVVVSPKTEEIQPRIHDVAAAFKYVIKHGEIDPNDGLPFTSTQVLGGKKHRLARPRLNAPVYLSPMDEGEENLNALNRRTVAEMAMTFGYRAGLQLHKFMDLP